MKTNIIRLSSIMVIALSAFSILSISVMAFINPQQVMNFVQVKLQTTDAYSSIRGVYGGVGITIVAALLFLSIKKLNYGLWFLTCLWGMYSLSRIITVITDGPLGNFGKQWLVIESVFAITALLLVLIAKPANSKLKTS